jgi:hypothetical protein
MLRDCPIDHRCMKRISVDQVLAAVVASLAGSEANRAPRPSSPDPRLDAAAGVEAS